MCVEMPTSDASLDDIHWQVTESSAHDTDPVSAGLPGTASVGGCDHLWTTVSSMCLVRTPCLLDCSALTTADCVRYFQLPLHGQVLIDRNDPMNLSVVPNNKKTRATTHALIFCTCSNFWLTPFSKSTTVNGTRHRLSVNLSHGDVLRFGGSQSFKLICRLPPQVEGHQADVIQEERVPSTQPSDSVCHVTNPVYMLANATISRDCAMSSVGGACRYSTAVQPASIHTAFCSDTAAGYNQRSPSDTYSSVTDHHTVQINFCHGRATGSGTVTYCGVPADLYVNSSVADSVSSPQHSAQYSSPPYTGRIMTNGSLTREATSLSRLNSSSAANTSHYLTNKSSNLNHIHSPRMGTRCTVESSTTATRNSAIFTDSAVPNTESHVTHITQHAYDNYGLEDSALSDCAEVDAHQRPVNGHSADEQEALTAVPSALAYTANVSYYLCDSLRPVIESADCPPNTRTCVSQDFHNCVLATRQLCLQVLENERELKILLQQVEPDVALVDSEYADCQTRCDSLTQRLRFLSSSHDVRVAAIRSDIQTITIEMDHVMHKMADLKAELVDMESSACRSTQEYTAAAGDMSRADCVSLQTALIEQQRRAYDELEFRQMEHETTLQEELEDFSRSSSQLADQIDTLRCQLKCINSQRANMLQSNRDKITQMTTHLSAYRLKIKKNLEDLSCLRMRMRHHTLGVTVLSEHDQLCAEFADLIHSLSNEQRAKDPSVYIPRLFSEDSTPSLFNTNGRVKSEENKSCCPSIAEPGVQSKDETLLADSVNTTSSSADTFDHPADTDSHLTSSASSLSSVRRRHKSLSPNSITQRPLTRYLPITEESLDLRAHILSAGHQLDICPHVSISSFICRGYLYKLGSRFRSWQRRWFLFDRRPESRCLQYFASRSENKFKGLINFSCIEEVYVDHMNKIKPLNPACTILCLRTSQRLYYLCGETAQTSRIWIDVLMTGISAASYPPRSLYV